MKIALCQVSSSRSDDTAQSTSPIPTPTTDFYYPPTYYSSQPFPCFLSITIPFYPTFAQTQERRDVPTSFMAQPLPTNGDPTAYLPFAHPRRSRRRYRSAGQPQWTYRGNFVDTCYGQTPYTYPTQSSYAYPTYPSPWTTGVASQGPQWYSYVPRAY